MLQSHYFSFRMCVCVCVCRGGGVMRGAQMLGGMGTDNNKTIREIKINIVQQV